MGPSGPPPQSVLDQYWQWLFLMLTLLVTFGLRLVGLDIAGAILTGMLLGFAVVMVRDGMQQMSKYSLVYAVLCALNFFFDLLPLLTELGGRIQRASEPGETYTADGISRTTITITVRKTPFFDADMGLAYNAQSLSMLVSPIAMALGTYLAICAHNETEFPLDYEQDFGNANAIRLQRGVLAAAAAANNGSPPAGPNGARGNSAPGSGDSTFQRFHGTSFKLDA